MFETSQEITTKSMVKISKTTARSREGTSEQTEMMVDQAKMQDELFFRTRVENEEFEEALIYFLDK